MPGWVSFIPTIPTKEGQFSTGVDRLERDSSAAIRWVKFNRLRNALWLEHVVVEGQHVAQFNRLRNALWLELQRPR